MSKIEEKSMSKEEAMYIAVFTTDEYKYKYIRLKTISNLILKVAGMLNVVIGAVGILIGIFV